MIDNATWEQIFTEDSAYNIQLLVAVSGGTYLTNTEIAQESMAITPNAIIFGRLGSAVRKMARTPNANHVQIRSTNR